MKLIYFIIILIHLILTESEMIPSNTNSTNRKLSRRKRYIIFPEGSSFQLVYCLTIPTYGMGQIFTIGLTAALAWELPSKPIDFKQKKTTENADKRVDKQKHPSNFYQYQSIPESIGQTINVYRKPWSTQSTYNTSPRYPYYMAWSGGNSGHTGNTGNTGNAGNTRRTNFETSDGDDEDNNNNWTHLPAYKSHYLYRKHGTVHRRTRRDLFAKIEKFFIAQNKDGIACLLKALCEVNQTNGVEKGTFIEEILRAIFTWIPEDDNADDPNGYNTAATHKGNCTEKYSSCTQSVWNPFF